MADRNAVAKIYCHCLSTFLILDLIESLILNKQCNAAFDMLFLKVKQYDVTFKYLCKKGQKCNQIQRALLSPDSCLGVISIKFRIAPSPTPPIFKNSWIYSWKPD